MASATLTTSTLTLTHPHPNLSLFHTPASPLPLPLLSRGRRFKICSTSTQQSTTPLVQGPDNKDEAQGQYGKEKFEWYQQWYAVAPVCDLDKRVPHGMRIVGIDVVVWWDKNEEQWKVFDDCCPHRLAPLSEGRIDGWGRLQCVYHGWCFNGQGKCQLIPQAPTDGPPVHTFKKACVASYPCALQSEILWFWPSSDPQFQDILSKKQPPYIPELDDPSYSKSMGIRDIPYGYEVLTENLMDPAHVHYAHYGIMRVPTDKNRPKADREGGKPLDFTVLKLDQSGFVTKQERGSSKFVAPCLVYVSPTGFPGTDAPSMSVSEKESEAKKKKIALIFICIPVSPGKSRLIWTFPRNFGVWIDKVVPRWLFHIGQNLILDSDLYLLHLEEHKIKEFGVKNWQEACFVPTKSDALVVAFRKWLTKYSAGEVDWGMKFDGTLPPTPPKEVLMDRYQSHVVKCTSCSSAYKGLKIAETVLQILAIALIGIVGVVSQGALTTFRRSAMFATSLILFAASKWLSNFIYKTFHFHDYNHALV